jgi:hypothetical protein
MERTTMELNDQQLSLLPTVTITSRSLNLPDGCTLELWEDCGSKIGICVDAGPFIIGDWINEGIKRHGISLASFIKSDAAKMMPGISSFSYDSLNSFASVMEKIPKDYRVNGVSFAHHHSASKLISDEKHSLSEVRGWLQIAKDRRLSLRDMTFAMRGRAKLADLLSNKETISPRAEQRTLQMKMSIGDVALTIHRQFKPLIDQFQDEDDPVEAWAPERKQAAKIALEPVLEDMASITDYYVYLCK